MRVSLSRKAFLLACVLGAAGAGCLLTTDLEGLASEPAQTPVEGGATEGAVPPVDGGADTSTASDTGTDAPPDGGKASPCKAVHAFCRDFDRDQPDFGWTSTEATSPAGTLTFDPFAVSAPRSMRARHPRGTRAASSKAASR